jgi:hypothetical protein
MLLNKFGALHDSNYVKTAFDSGFLFQHLFRFDTAKQEWHDLTEDLDGSPPSPRTSPCTTSVESKIYVFGGMRNGAAKIDFL